MAAGPWTPVNGARTEIMNSYIAGASARTFKVALVLSTSNVGAASTTWAGVTNEVANGNGYTTGGQTVTLSLSGTTTVQVFFASNPVWTASGAGITARTAVLYAVGGNVLATSVLDSTPADVTVSAGNQLTVDSDGTPAPVFTFGS
jgi:hypothetical protein